MLPLNCENVLSFQFIWRENNVVLAEKEKERQFIKEKTLEFLHPAEQVAEEVSPFLRVLSSSAPSSLAQKNMVEVVIV